MIDGILHAVASTVSVIGSALRNYIDIPLINGFGDSVGEGTKWFGQKFRVIQSGRIQQYMIVALVFTFGTLFYLVFALLKP